MLRIRSLVVAVIFATGSLIAFPAISAVEASKSDEIVIPHNRDTQSNHNKKTPTARLPKEGTRLGVMFIPKLKVRSSIVEGVTDPMFDIGMGHWPGTAMPGERGNAVYGGHRTAGPRPLYDVQRLRRGDSIIILRGLKRYQYEVIATRIVKPTALWITYQTSGKTLTLFTCHPRHSTKQRYVIQAILRK
jgi:sortase A